MTAPMEYFSGDLATKTSTHLEHVGLICALVDVNVKLTLAFYTPLGDPLIWREGKEVG